MKIKKIYYIGPKKMRQITTANFADNHPVDKTTKKDYIASVKDLIEEHDISTGKVHDEKYMARAKQLLSGEENADRLLVIIMSS